MQRVTLCPWAESLRLSQKPMPAAIVTGAADGVSTDG